VIRSRGTSQVKAIISATMSNVGRIQAFRRTRVAASSKRHDQRSNRTADRIICGPLPLIFELPRQERTAIPAARNDQRAVGWCRDDPLPMSTLRAADHSVAVGQGLSTFARSAANASRQADQQGPDLQHRFRAEATRSSNRCVIDACWLQMGAGTDRRPISGPDLVPVSSKAT
jgi:hypothetical protein